MLLAISTELLEISASLLLIPAALFEIPAALFETSVTMLLMAAALAAKSTYFDKKGDTFGHVIIYFNFYWSLRSNDNVTGNTGKIVCLMN